MTGTPTTTPSPSPAADPPAGPWRPRPAAVVERALLGSFASGVLAAALLAAKNDLAPLQAPSTFALEFGRWLVAGHVLAGVVLALVAGLLARRWPGPSSVLVRLAAAGVLLAAVLGNSRVMSWVGELTGPDAFRRFLPAALVASALALAAAAAAPARSRWPLRVLALAAGVAFYVAVRPPAAVTGPAAAGTSQAAPRLSGPRLLVLGIDGADWAYAEPLIARGLLPNLQRLREGAAWGPLESMQPTLSPVIWTSIATGQKPSRHGIRGFTTPRVRGVLNTLPRLRPVHALGYGAVREWMNRRSIIHSAPVSSLSRREPAIWTLMTQARQPVNVLNWWATWPAEPVLGHMVSERAHHWRFSARGWGTETEGLTWPPELHAQLREDFMAPDQVGFEQARAFVDMDKAALEAMLAQPFQKHIVEGELKYFLSMYESNRRVARRLAELDRARYGRAADLIMLERLVDLACHAALVSSELVDEHLDSPPERQARYGRVVTQAYVAVDALLGDLLQEYEHDNVVVLSDHGFRLESHWPDWHQSYGHDKAPAGIFVARGPAFRPGRVEGLGVLDLFPLLARVKGLPLADDLPRPVPEQVLSAAVLAQPPVRVRRYQAGASGAGQEDEGTDEEMLERLRALGYVQ